MSVRHGFTEIFISHLQKHPFCDIDDVRVYAFSSEARGGWAHSEREAPSVDQDVAAKLQEHESVHDKAEARRDEHLAKRRVGQFDRNRANCQLTIM